MKAGVDCETDPLHPCSRCISKKQRCSLMPVNEKTGKADRSKVREEDILQYRIDQVKKRAGKQPVRRRRQVTEVGSGASPSTMLMTLDLETPSSHSPVTPSGSPPRTSGSPAAAGATEPRP